MDSNTDWSDVTRPELTNGTRNGVPQKSVNDGVEGPETDSWMEGSRLVGTMEATWC